MPALNRIHNKYAEKTKKLSASPSILKIKSSNFLKRPLSDIPCSSIQDGAMEFSKRLGNRFGLLPHTVVIGADGKQIFSKLGVIQEQGFEAIIMEHLPK